MTITAATKRIVLERQGERCAVCGKHLEPDMPAAFRKYLPPGRSPVEFDHVRPKSQGGGDGPGNVQAVDGWCHHGKTEGERPDYRLASYSPLRDVVRGKGGGKLRRVG